MTSPEPSPDRKERMKQILAESYPRGRKADREPLPKSVLAELVGLPPEETEVRERFPLLRRIVSFLQSPQALGLGAAAALVAVAIIAFLPQDPAPPGTEDPSGGTQLRNGGDTAAPAPFVVVVYGLAEGQVKSLRDSGLFSAEQLAVVPSGRELSSFTAEKRSPLLILVDGTKGTISMPFAEKEPFAPRLFDEDSDLATMLLDLKSEIAPPIAP